MISNYYPVHLGTMQSICKNSLSNSETTAGKFSPGTSRAMHGSLRTIESKLQLLALSIAYIEAAQKKEWEI